jgi:hypothetical protein
VRFLYAKGFANGKTRRFSQNFGLELDLKIQPLVPSRVANSPAAKFFTDPFLVEVHRVILSPNPP